MICSSSMRINVLTRCSLSHSQLQLCIKPSKEFLKCPARHLPSQGLDSVVRPPRPYFFLRSSPKWFSLQPGLRNTSLLYSNALTTKALINPDYMQNGQEDRRRRSDPPQCIPSRDQSQLLCSLWSQFWAEFLWLTLCLGNHLEGGVSWKVIWLCKHSQAGRFTCMLELNILIYLWNHSHFFPITGSRVPQVQRVKTVNTHPATWGL